MSESLERIRVALAGRYEIERQLGQGGMAIVYLARDLKHDRTVALKVLKPEVALALGGDRFLREIRLASHLQHPNILAVWDSGDADGTLYFVMPFVSGESLRDRLDRETQLSLEDAVSVTREVADALQYAHDKGIVHRDIKPENILLQEGHAILADFGIARAASESETKLTETGMSVGTPTYMSPEQAMGSNVDGRSDQYSLGCVLYEMLAGQPPFDGNNTMAILAKHSMEAVPSLQVVRSSIPDDIEDAVMRALEKTPADRFRTMKEFAGALGMADISTAARRTPTRGNIRRTSGRVAAPPARRGPRRALVAGVLAVLVSAGGFLAWSQLGARDTPAAETGPDARRIAVMYFDSRGGDSLQFLADGLTDALIGELSRVKPLEVISRNGVAPYKNAPAAPDSVGRALRVGTLVTGDVAQSGGMLRVNVSMIDAGSGELITSTRIEKPRSELFALQDSIAAEVSNFLRIRIGEQIERRASRAGTRNAQAWELLQHAREEAAGIDRIIATGDTGAIARQFARTDSIYAAAAGADPAWASPLTERGWLSYRLMRLASSKTEAEELITQGQRHAAAALALSANDPDALELQATLTYWRWLLGLETSSDRAAQILADAERDYRAAVTANPQQASAWTSLSHLLINKAQVAEANLAASRAYEADPYLTNANVTLWRLFTTSLDLEDEIQARRWCEEGSRRFGSDPRFVECRLLLFALKGVQPDVGEAWRLLDEYVLLSPPELRPFRQLRGQMIVATALARAGLDDSARSVILRSRAPDAQFDPTRELAYLEAVARTILGDTDEAFSQLSLFLATNPAQRATFAADQTWWFRPLRSDRRYRSLTGGA